MNRKKTAKSIKKNIFEDKLDYEMDLSANDNIYYKISNNFFEKDDSKILMKYILNKDDDTFLFDGKVFKYYNRENKYLRKDKIKRKIYKCVHYRKNENIKNELSKCPSFCNSTIIYIEPGQGKEEGYYFKKDHSLECYSLYNIKIKSKAIKKKIKKNLN